MKVLAVTGASGGHIYPALSFLDSLKSRDSLIEALLVLPSRSIGVNFAAVGYRVEYISSAKFSHSLNRGNILAVLKFFKGTWESLRILLAFKPDIVVGFGTLDSAPLLIFAWLFRIKTLIHEQNVLPGKANKLLAKFADKVAISFKETGDYLSVDKDKLLLTGNPIRGSLRKIDRIEALNYLGLTGGNFTILVMGGSQGSRNINAGFIKAVSGIKNTSGVEVIHLAGRSDYETIKREYAKINISVKVFDFLNAMEYAYSASDLIISRAGATTISELLFFKLPAIISPYPYAYKHQLQNAKLLQQKGCAVIIEDSQLDNDMFKETIESLITDRGKLNKMRLAFGTSPIPDAGSLLADAALDLN